MKCNASCEQIDLCLDERLDYDVLPVEAARHLLDCPTCRELYRLMQSPLPDVEVPRHLRERILRSIRGSMTAVDAPGPSWKRALVLLAVYGTVVAVAVGLTGQQPH